MPFARLWELKVITASKAPRTALMLMDKAWIIRRKDLGRVINELLDRSFLYGESDLSDTYLGDEALRLAKALKVRNRSTLANFTCSCNVLLDPWILMTAACLVWIGCNPPIASKNWSKEGKAGAAHCASRVRFLFDRAQCNTKSVHSTLGNPRELFHALNPEPNNPTVPHKSYENWEFPDPAPKKRLCASPISISRVKHHPKTLALWTSRCFRNARPKI